MKHREPEYISNSFARRSIIRSPALWFLLASFPLFLVAQQPLFQSRNLPLDFIAKQICQDSEGFLWLGGESGLYRYDGQVYESYPLPDSLQKLEISSLLIDGKTLWLGFVNGSIFRLNTSGQEISNLHYQPAKAAVRDLLIGPEGRLWVATAGEGLWYLHDNQWGQVSDLPDDYLYDLIQGPEHRIWAGTDRGIAWIDPTSGKYLRTLAQPEGLQDEIVQSLLLTEENEVWIGTYDGGLAHYSPILDTIVHQPNWSWGAIQCLEASSDGIWIGTDRKGLIWRDKSGQTFRLDKEKRVRVEKVLLDQSGNLWTLDQTHGLRIATAAFLLFPTEKPVQALYAVEDRIWYATEDGIYLYHSIENTTERLEIPLQGRVLSLHEDRNGFVWIGTQGDGVWQLSQDRQRFLHITEADGLINDHILSISEGADSIWFATFGGVASCARQSEISLSTFRPYNRSDGLGVNYIYQAYIDSRQRVWLATDGKGIYTREGQSFQWVKGSGSQTFLAITEDHNQNLWFHSQDSGLYVLKGDSLLNVPLPENIRSRSFTGMEADGTGRLLLLGEEGLSLLNPENGQLLDFGSQQGFPSVGPFLNLCSQAPSGKLWLGTDRGLICYNPRLLPLNNLPVAHITEVTSLTSELTPYQGIQFKSDENSLSFAYTALWFQAPGAVSFEHRLLGLDLDWVSSRNRKVIYPRLAPGKYTFELRASHQNDFAAAAIERFSFEVLRPFWQSWWFWLLIILSLVGGSYWWIRMRENRLRQTERLERAYLTAQFETLKSQINPHFLFNSFNTLAAIIEEQPKEAIHYVEHLSDLFRNILEYRKRSVISLREELKLLDKFYYLQRFRYQKGFQLEIQVPEQVLQYGVPPMSLQLLVENALKHNIVSERQPLKVCVSVLSSDVLCVRNNLQLRRDHSPSTRIGQENIRQRYQLLTSKLVEIEVSESFYSVHLPLLPPAI